jgi:hypothetical protein
MQYQAFEKGALSKGNDRDELSEEDAMDEQYLSMLLASEKDKDVKAYARMRNIQVCLRSSVTRILTRLK